MLENFIYAKQKSLFEKKLNNGEILDEAIVFIEDTKEIWNHGTYFPTITDFYKTKLEETPFIKGEGQDSAVSDSDRGCEATGENSFATGIYAKATGVSSAAIGRYCQATGRAAIAAGGFLSSIKLTGDANAVTYTCTPNFTQKNYPSHLIGSDILSYDETDGTNNVLATITGATLLDDSTLLLTLDKTLSSEAISNKDFGIFFCHAKGTSSIALALSVGAFGKGSVAMGQSLAAGNYSVATGVSIASGTMSSTTGNGTIASGNYSHAECNFTTASGGASHAEGGGLWNIYFSGDGTDNKYLIKNGSNWQFTEDLEKLVGTNVYENLTLIATILSYELAEDGYTITVVLDKSLGTLDPYGKYAVGLGIAESDYSHSQNGGTKASGEKSTSTGELTVAEGKASATFGNRTIARGDSSATFGEHTFTTNTAEFALGVSNISHTGETTDALTLLSVGYGEGEPGLDMSTRIEQLIPFKSMADGKNALEVMRNGDIWFGGYETGLKVWDGENLTSPAIPTKTSELENDSGFLARSLTGYAVDNLYVKDYLRRSNGGDTLDWSASNKYIKVLDASGDNTILNIHAKGDGTKFLSDDGTYKEISEIGGGMTISGTVNLTNGTFNTQNNSSLNSYSKVFDNMSTGEMRMYLVSDSNGNLPSISETAITVPYDGILSPAQVYFGKSSAFGVSVGDICVLFKKSSILNVCRIIPLNDVKPANGDFPGADGLSTVWDKTRINKVDGIEWTANHVRDTYLPKSDRFPSRTGWLLAVDTCLDNGVYPTCSSTTIPSTGWTNNYFTCIVQRTSTNDGAFDTIEQTAYGRGSDEGDVYKRIIFYKSDGTDTQYGDWICISNRKLGKASKNYFRFVGVYEESYIGLHVYNSPDLKYSLDGTNWISWDFDDGLPALKLKKNEIVYFKGNNPDSFSDDTIPNYFLIVGGVKVCGNIMSLLYEDDFEDKFEIDVNQTFSRLFEDLKGLLYADELVLPATTLKAGVYQGMFLGCTSLITAPKLPATTLTLYCYHNMFYECTSLVSAPELPATILAPGCYQTMFQGCTSLTTAPELPATYLIDNCYYGMFHGCTKLNYIRMLATDISASECLTSWVDGVASTGIFVKYSNSVSLPTGISGIPEGWDIFSSQSSPSSPSSPKL